MDFTILPRSLHSLRRFGAAGLYVVLLACYVAIYLALLESKENKLVESSVDDFMDEYEKVNEHWWKARWLPHVNSKEYILELAQFVMHKDVRR